MKRTLSFRSYDDILADAEGLSAGGYEKTGNWGLGQTCDHLARTMERSLDGFSSKYPWLFQRLARLIALGAILKHKPSNRRFPAPDDLLTNDAPDDGSGLSRLRAAVGRLKAHAGPIQPHPVFGKVSPEQWREIHLWHSEHHLGFLTPRSAARPAAGS
jgi:hypothetical protein